MTVLFVGFGRTEEEVTSLPHRPENDPYEYVLLIETGPGFTSAHVRKRKWRICSATAQR